MKYFAFLELFAKLGGGVPHNSSENSISLSSENTSSVSQLNYDESGKVEHYENERHTEKFEEQNDEPIGRKETDNSNVALVDFFRQRIANFEDSDLGKLCAEIIESYKGRELGAESLAAYVERLEQMEGSEPLSTELKTLLEQCEHGDEGASFWQRILQPSTSGTIRATRSLIEGFLKAMKLVSENFEIRNIAKELVANLGEVALEKVREMVHSPQPSSLTPEQMTDLLKQMQNLYDHCPKNQ